MNNYKQMTSEEKQALGEAISKLSEEDQAQIAAAGKINDEQCEKIKEIVGPVIAIGYGAPMPISPIISEIAERLKQPQIESQGSQRTEDGDV